MKCIAALNIYLYIIIIFITHILFTNAQNCLNEISNPKCTFGTKTPYRYIANYNISHLNYNGCTEKKIWMLVRHGTRYPKEKHILALLQNLSLFRNKILYNYHNDKSNITKELVEALHNWKTDFSTDYSMKLGTEGEFEMMSLAFRMKSRFPSLFPEYYNESIYDIHHTPTQRAQESARFFGLGLFGSHKSENIKYPIVEKKMFISRFYKMCERWQNEINHNPATYNEKTKFMNSELVKNMLQNISDYIGFKVNNGDIRLIRMMCVFETALNQSINHSPWCDIFSFDQLKILEYAEDVGYYWIDGYGHKLTYEQACPALIDVFDFFQSNSSLLARMYFSHSGTILKLLALLNIAKDEQPLTHDTFFLHRDNRNWRVSLIDAFASNIAFILYDCQNDGLGIVTMHQERVVYLPNCPQDRPCSLDIMKKLYVDNEEECHFHNMCTTREKKEL